jgi:hypothetical protein
VTLPYESRPLLQDRPFPAVDSTDLDAALRDFPRRERDRLRHWRRLPDGSLRVFLGGRRRAAVAAAVALIPTTALAVAAARVVVPPWNWLLVAFDVATIVALVWTADRWGRTATITADAITIGRLFRSERVSLTSATGVSIAIGRRAVRASFGSRFTRVPAPTVDISGPEGIARFRFRYLSEAVLFQTELGSHRPDLDSANGTASVRRVRTLAPGWGPSFAGGFLLGGLTFVHLVAPFLAIGALTADRTDPRGTASAADLVAGIELLAGRLPAPAQPDGLDIAVRVESCALDNAFLRPDPPSSRITVLVGQPISPNEARVDRWRDEVIDRMGPHGTITFRSSDLDVAIPVSRDQLVARIVTSCVDADTRERERITNAATTLALAMIAVEPQIR